MSSGRPLRIVVYPHLLSIGGSQLNAIELAAAVRDLGHYVQIFGARPGALISLIGELGLPLELAPSHKKRPSLLISRALRHLCRRDAIDIVHGYEWPPCLEGFFGPMLCDGVATGCTVMSMSVAPFIPSSIPLIVGTEQIAAAAQLGRQSQVAVIEPPVDTVANHPQIDGRHFRAEYGLEDRPTVVLVSRLAVALKLEGIERAIAAVGVLAAESRIRLVVVGDGPARNQLARAADAVNSRTGETTIVLTGELADPRPAYAAGDVVLGMGGSALRAMAFAKPVVILGELGFAELLTPQSAPTFLWQGFYGLGNGDMAPTKLADLLRPLLNNPGLRSELGTFARHFLESRFSLTGAADKQVQLYREWMHNRPRRTTLAMQAVGTAVQVLAHKSRQRVNRLRNKAASEDFNSLTNIAKVSKKTVNGR